VSLRKRVIARHLTSPRVAPALVLTLCVALVGQGCRNDAGTTKAQGSGSEDGLIVKVASYDLAVGTQRFLVGVLTPEERQIGWGNVKMKFAYLGTKTNQLTGEVVSEIDASYLPIPAERGKPAPEPKQGPTIVAGAEGRGVYAGEANFDQAGFWGVVVEASIDGGAVVEGKAAFEVLDKHRYPWVGEDAPRSENLTSASTDAPRAAIDSRAGPNDGPIPDEALHQSTVAAGIASGKPTLLVVSTPVYCISRFCGPVTDVVQQLSEEYGEAANFVHIEVWRNFQSMEVNKAAAEWVLRDDNILEPWVWLIGGDGKIGARWDNVATRQEIEPALKALLSG
jgi:hypothetical protein